jgi:hypothetical protein
MKVNVLKYGVAKKYKRCNIKDNKGTFVTIEESNFTFQFFEPRKDILNEYEGEPIMEHLLQTNQHHSKLNHFKLKK